jgi:hypothetical protein
VWQALHAEHEAAGLSVVSVALDINPEHARRWITAAAPTHPSLIDTAHVTDELFGFMNVPMCVWIDEVGVIVRPAEVASIERTARRDAPIREDLPDRIKQIMVEVRKLESNPDAYRAAISDWVVHGSESAYSLSPDEVVARSGGRPIEHATAAAYFELGQHLFRTEGNDAAVPWWREAHRLYPENFTYKRQAWTLVTTPEGAEANDLIQGPNEVYDGNWLDDVRAIGGGDHYYPPLRL